MEFIVNGALVLNRPYTFPLPTMAKTFFDQIIDLPDMFVKVLLSHTYEMQNNFDDHLFDELSTSLTNAFASDFGVQVDPQEIEMEQILMQSFMSYRADKRFPKYIVSSDDVALWIQLTVNVDLGMLEEPFRLGSKIAEDVVDRSVKAAVDKQLAEKFGNGAVSEFQIEERFDDRDDIVANP